MTMVEVLVTMAITAVLLGLLLAVLARVRKAQRQVDCVSTLRSLAGAFHQYAHDHHERFPDPAQANRSWEQMLLKYHTGSFACQADDELYPAVGSSYDWRDTGRPSTSLAGRSLHEVTRNSAILVFEALPGWHARRKINVARVDSSVETVDDDACVRDLQQPVVSAPDAED